MKKYIFIIALILVVGLQACNSNGTGANRARAKAITAIEYNYLVKDYAKNTDANLSKGLSQKEVFTKNTSVTYKGEPATYKFTAFDIMHEGETVPTAVFVRFEIDRLFSSLGGQSQRKQETKHFCIPSAKASSGLHDSYNEAVQKLGYKDYEVFLSNLTQLFAEVYL